MQASVVICTRNRAASLQRTLESVEAATRPSGDWELLIVDNGSTDHTADIVDSFKGRLPIRRVVEPEAGLSRARNRGVTEATGEYIIWTDDDVVVDPGWLAGYLAAFSKHPTAALFAGQIHPELESPQTAWFAKGQKHLASLLALREFSSELPLSDRLVPFGANYAVHTATQRQHPYDPELGVAPGRRRGGEETAVARAILSSGEAGITVPGSIVYHLIPLSRQSRDYVQEYYISDGESWPVMAPRPGVIVVGGAPAKMLLKLMISRIEYYIKRYLGGDWLPAFVEQARVIGTCKCWERYLSQLDHAGRP